MALLVLGVPIIDTFWIITRRLLSGQSPFTPDRGHFHHRLLDLGLTHKGAVLLIYAICALLALLSVVLAGGSGPLYAFMAVVVGSGLLLLLVTFRFGPDEALEASTYDDAGMTMARRPLPTAETARDVRDSREVQPSVLLYSTPSAGRPWTYGKSFAYFALFTEIGLVLFVTTLGGLAGHWLDEQVGTKPLLVMGGSCSGSCLARWPTGAS